MTEKPERIAEPDFSILISECQKYIDAKAIDGFADSTDVCNAAIEAVFGEAVFMWIGDQVLEATWEAEKDIPFPLRWFQDVEKGEENKMTTMSDHVKERGRLRDETIRDENSNE